MIFTLATKEDALAMASIHKAEIGKGFLSSLSPAFLQRFYIALVVSGASFCVVAKENNQVVGFASGVTNMNKFYKYFLLHYFFQSFIILLPKIFSSFKKILEAMLYPVKNEEYLPQAELLVIAITKEFQGKGVGGLMLSAFVLEMKKGNISIFKVVVGEELKQAITFYEKNNFKFIKNINIHGKASSRVYCYEVT